MTQRERKTKEVLAVMREERGNGVSRFSSEIAVGSLQRDRPIVYDYGSGVSQSNR